MESARQRVLGSHSRVCSPNTQSAKQEWGNPPVTRYLLAHIPTSPIHFRGFEAVLWRKFRSLTAGRRERPTCHTRRAWPFVISRTTSSEGVTRVRCRAPVSCPNDALNWRDLASPRNASGSTRPFAAHITMYPPRLLVALWATPTTCAECNP